MMHIKRHTASSTPFGPDSNNNSIDAVPATVVATAAAAATADADDVAADLSYRQQRLSIKEFYNDATVLVTGGTGFLGKVLIEKLLRTCSLVRCVYVLLRAKKGRSSEERYTEFVQNPVRVFLQNLCQQTFITECKSRTT